MTNYLVTGGAGFIGSHLVEALTRRPDTAQIRVLDNLATGHRHNLAAVSSRLEFVEGDLTDPTALKQAVEGVDVIFHLAAQVSAPKSMFDPLTTQEINATGTLKLLEAAHQAGARRLVFSSTSAVYGDDPTLPKVEDMRPQPKSPYAIAKLTGEHYCRYATDYHGLETVVLRYFNVYGPRQDPSSAYSGVISIFIDRLLKDEPITIFGDGEQTRDFVFVTDVVAANLAASEQADAVGRTFNIGTGQTVSINQLYEATSQYLNKTTAPRYEAARAGDIKYSWTDPVLAKQYLNWTAQVPFADGLAQTINSVRAG
jgi:UDP-glucose 4-epimerase